MRPRRVIEERMPGNLQTSVATEQASFETLRREWNELIEGCERTSIFFQFEWFDAAWQWLKRDSLMRIIAVRRENSLVAVCPMVLQRRKFHGVPIWTLSFLTVPDTQECDVLVRDADRDEVCENIAAYLTYTQREWDSLEFGYLNEDSCVVQKLAHTLLRYGIRVNVVSEAENPWICLQDSWTSYYGRRSRRLKKGNNLVSNRLIKTASEIRIHHVRPDNQMWSPDKTFEVLESLSRSSWKANTGNTLDYAGPGAFVGRLIEHAWNREWLSVWLLSLDEEYVASELQLSFRGNVYALRADYTAHTRELSPGTYLNWKMLERLFETGEKRYYMGPGGNPYKQRWAENGTKLVKLGGYSVSKKGRWLNLADRAFVTMKRTVRELIAGSRGP